jgi:hypothetical protein
VALPSKVWICGRRIAGIEGSNPTDDRGLLFVVRRAIIGLNDGLITRPEEPYQLCVCVCARACVIVCVSVCELETATMRSPRSNLGCCATGKKKSITISTTDLL